MIKSMIADTNILIRLFTKDDEVQVEQLVQIMERGDITFYILSIVLIEAYWVLRRVYEVEKDKILHAFEEFIESDGVELEEENLMQRVLSCFREVNVDYIDVYIAEKSRSLGLPVLTWNCTYSHYRKKRMRTSKASNPNVPMVTAIPSVE